VDIPAHLEEVALLFEEMPFETALEEVAAAAMAAIEVACIAAIEVLHAGRQVRLGRFHKEMVVVPHEHERMDPPSVGLDRPPQPVQPLHDVLPSVPARHDMVEGPGKFDPQRSGHTTILPRRSPKSTPNHYSSSDPDDVLLIEVLQRDAQQLVPAQQVVEADIAGVLAIVGHRLPAQTAAAAQIVDV